MRRIRTHLPPTIYPDDPWALLEEEFAPDFLYLTETIFAQSNGMIGVRGTLDEGEPTHSIGTYLNGFHETWPITHAESAYGLARTGQTIVTLPDGLQMNVFVDGERFVLPEVEILRCRRWLDFRSGILERDIEWRTRSGVVVRQRFRRLVSLEIPELIVTHMELVTDAPADVRVESRLINRLDAEQRRGVADDPRRATTFDHRVLEPRAATLEGLRFVQAWMTTNSRFGLLSAVDHRLEGPTPNLHYDRSASDFGFEFTWKLGADEVVEITKFISHHHNGATGLPERDAVAATLDRACEMGFDAIALRQREILGEFWARYDIEVEADPEMQRAIRWTLFQLLSNSACLDGASIPAKGLTGHAYDGHYFWDTEIYLLPFLIYTNRGAARTVLEHRYSGLEKAKQRARTLSHPGALFPWRTINGEEASAYFLAGTAQYHIDADIVYAIRKYVELTGDDEFLWSMGAEMAFETARFFEDLGFYRDGEFHIHGVTGPDEYTALVDDNAYTNAMARMNLRYAAHVARRFEREHPDRYRTLVESIGLEDTEIEGWMRAATAMYMPYDSERGITPQDDDFLEMEPWDFEGTPPSKYPLLLHFHPLTIYRYQVLKQADVVLADFLLGEEFSETLKRANFEFYDPLTTGDSSLSACIQAIMSAELGYGDQAMRHFQHALFMDLGDIAGNTTDGVHMASAGGVWMALAYGFAGMRDTGGRISFDPRLPDSWGRMRFAISVRGSLLRIDLTSNELHLEAAGEPMTVTVRGTDVKVPVGTRVGVPLA